MKELSQKAPEVKEGKKEFRAFSGSVVRAIDEEKRTIDFVISTERVDRYGDIIRVKGWDLKEYRKNPVVLFGHDGRSPPIGKASNVQKSDESLIATAQFMDESISPFANAIFRMYQEKYLRAVSVGFMPKKWQYIEEEQEDGYKRITGYEFLKQELLEFSCVPIPANPDALMDARSKGIDTKPFRDWAEYLLEHWDKPDPVVMMLGTTRKQVEDIRRKAAGVGLIHFLPKRIQDDLLERNLAAVRKQKDNNMSNTNENEKKEEVKEKTVQTGEGGKGEAEKTTVKVPESETIVVEAQKSSIELLLEKLPEADSASEAKYVDEAQNSIIKSSMKGDKKTFEVLDAPKISFFTLQAVEKGVDEKTIKLNEKDGLIILTLEGENLIAQYRLVCRDEEAETYYGERVARQAKESGAAEVEEEQEEKEVTGKVEEKKEEKTAATTKDESGLDDIETAFLNFERAVAKFEELASSEKVKNNRAYTRKAKYLADCMRTVAGEISPASTIQLKGHDEGLDLEQVTKYLETNLLPKIPAMVERQVDKLRGRLS